MLTKVILRLRNKLLYSVYKSARLSKRNVSTISHLANAFNTRPGHKLSFETKTGLFGIEELRSYDGFYLLKENVIVQTENLVKEACSMIRDRKIVDIFDELSDTLCKVADLAEFVRLAHPKGSYSNAAEDAVNTVSRIVEKLNTNKSLYRVLRKAVLEGDAFPLNDVEKHVSTLFLFDFEQCGIHLEESERKQVVQLNDAILHLGQRFMAGALSPRIISKSSIPSQLRHLFNIDGDTVTISGLFSESKEEIAREIAYKAYLLPEPNQVTLLSDLLQARHKLSQLCGFPTFAHRALRSSLAETPTDVYAFLDELSDRLRPRAEKDFECMMAMKSKETGSSQTLAPWDVAHFTNKAKTQYLQVQEFSTYFSLGTCMQGLDNLTKSLFGISLKNAPISPGEVWTPDIYKLDVVHESEGLLGSIYCDFYERPNKPNQDCHFTIRGGKRLANGSYQNPIVVLMLNFPMPRWSNPSLLTPSMVDNLFHEFGHGLHSMLARTNHQHVTGTRCATDFAEVPSVLMEFFASDPRILQTFARHYITGAEMPRDMIEKLCASKRVFAASEMQAQVFYSALDQEFHSGAITEPTMDILARVQNQYYSLPYVCNTAWELRFSHLVGYGAKYYSYLMSRAVASWVWLEYFSQDPLSRKAGEHYRHNCLAQGGALPPRQLIADFLGRAIDPSVLTEALIQDLDGQRKKAR